MTPATFLQHFPEFADTGANLIQAKLNEAAARMGMPGNRNWGCFADTGQPPTTADIAQGYLAANLLERNPLGMATLMSSDNPSEPSTYLTTYNEMVTENCSGPIVAGARLIF